MSTSRNDPRKDVQRDECIGVRPLLVPYLDGEATDEESAQVHAHLAGCSSCSSEAEIHRKIEGVVAALCSRPNELPAGFVERVRVVAKRRGRMRLLFYLSAAAVFLLASGLFLEGRRNAASKPAEELLSNLDILEELDEAGVEPTQELVKLLLGGSKEQGEAKNGDLLDTSLFDYLLEEEVAPEKL